MQIGKVDIKTNKAEYEKAINQDLLEDISEEAQKTFQTKDRTSSKALISGAETW